MKNNQSQKNVPNEWQLIPAGDIFTFVKSYAFSRDNLINNTNNSDGVGNIHYGDLHSTFLTPSINLKNISVPKIKDIKFTPKKDDYLVDGDLIMADASEDYEGVGITVSLHELEGKKIVGGLHTFVLRDKKNITDKYFRQYVFRNPNIRNSLQKVANGVSVYGISKTAVSKLLLPIPPIAEQKRIIKILETWDKTINNLQNKISTKKNIKNGLMQNLLSGKIRLDGFVSEWEFTKLGHLISNVSARNKDLRVLRVLSVTNKHGFVLPEKQFARVVASEDLSNYKVISKGDFAYNPSRINVGSLARLDDYEEAVLSPMYVAFRSNKNIDSDYLYHWLDTAEANGKIRSCASGSVRESVDFKSFSSIKIKIPKLDEQKAIVKILNASEKELLILEKKLSILKEQKRYLLNNLITGTIRTPETLSTKTTK